MKHRKTQLAAAAVVVLSIILGVHLFRDGTTPAYAVDQTIAAIEKIETVYMKGEFYWQGPFECWMRFDGDPDRPTHVWLGWEDLSMAKICAPDGIFSLNRNTKYLHFVTRDERGMSWIPKFGRLFGDLVKQAGRNDAIEIRPQVLSDPGSAVVVHIDTPKRTQEFVVDPDSKLPLRFATTREDAPMEMIRKGLVIKHLTAIRYNEEPPAGIFVKPADAVVVDQAIDCWVGPDSGLDVGEMPRAEACRELVRQACQAMIDLDEAKLKSLALFARRWPPPVWKQVRQMKEAGQWVQSYEITGEPYPEGDVWFVPAKLQTGDGKAEVQTAMIKFYDFDGVVRAFSVGSKEKGVVD